MAEREHTGHAPKGRSKVGDAREMIHHRVAAKVSLAGDDTKSAAPGGTTIAVAVGALVLGKMFGYAPSPSAALAPVPTNAPAGSILAGLNELIGKLTAGGAGPQVNSWIGHGANEPVQPGQLGSALGQEVLAELSQRTGLSQQELLNQLSTVLPQIINHMTPNGRMPMPADLEKDDLSDSLTGQIRSMASLTPGKFAHSALIIELMRADYFEAVSNLFGGRRILKSEIESDLEAHALLHRGLPRGALTSLIENLHFEPIRVRLMTGKPPSRDEHGVAPQRQARRPWVSHEPNARGAGDSAPLGCADRNRRDFEIGPRFDFDKGD